MMFPQIDGPVILHVCGRTMDRMELFAESGVDVYHFESANDAGEALAKVDGRISLAGNINNPETLLDGTPEEVFRQTREAIEAGLKLIAPECAIPLTTPLTNLRAVVEAVRQGF
jgi:[methyl-Co(III) methanol-specific corrinoid protein]:coenzyme M methyltransferase